MRTEALRAWKGLAAGLAGGLAGSWVMTRFQAEWKKVTAKRAVQTKEPQQQSEPTTVKTAVAVSRRILHRELTGQEKEVAGPAVHYVFGTGVGGVYGALSEFVPAVTVGTGMGFGAALWLAADETALPMLRLSGPPTAYALSTHVYGLVSHLVYGWSAEMVRRRVRALL